MKRAAGQACCSLRLQQEAAGRSLTHVAMPVSVILHSILTAYPGALTLACLVAQGAGKVNEALDRGASSSEPIKVDAKAGAKGLPALKPPPGAKGGKSGKGRK